MKTNLLRPLSKSLYPGSFRSGSTSAWRLLGIGKDKQLDNDHDPLLQKIRSKQPVRVTVTGPAGAIGYSLLFRLANGELLGAGQPISLSCLELPQALNALKGAAMELEDCAFPNLTSVTVTDDPNQAFDGCEIALLVGSKPRGPGQERSDLLKENGRIFQKLGQVMNEKAAKYCRVTVVGNPCNTNCLILANNCPDLSWRNFTAMTRLDHDRGLAMIARKCMLPVTEVNYFAIWGNHSSTMFPDLDHVRIHGVPWRELVGYFRSERYWQNEFIPKVQQRGAQIISVRGSSSAASAANAALAHTRDWILGTPQCDWTSMAVLSHGEYGVPRGLIASFPVWCKQGSWEIAKYPSAFTAFQQYYIEQTIKELESERDMVSEMLKF